jgi:uncharacterized membrane protein
MSLPSTADRLAEFDTIIRADIEKRDVLLQLLSKLQTLTSAMPESLRNPHAATAFVYGYGGLTGGYTGINAFLLK